jgi:hypothetical protein
MSSGSDPPLQGLAYDLAAERLRLACRWGGIALLGAPLLPFEFVGQTPIFVWTILGELHPAAVIAALFPTAVGALLLGLSLGVRRPSLLTLVTLLALATWAAVAALGADAAAWDIAALPDSLNQRVELATLTIAFAGAALRLLSEPVAARASRIVAAVSVGAGLLFALWPTEGEAPIQTCVRFIGAMFSLPDVRFVLGYGLILVMIAFPLIAAGVAASFSLAGLRRQAALVSEIVTFGLPAMLLLLVLRNVLLTFGDSSVIVISGFAATLAAILAVTARSLELLALWATGFGKRSDRETGAKLQRPLAFASGFAALSIIAVFILSRPIHKGIDWSLGTRSEKADRLFGDLLPKWAVSRARWGVFSALQVSSAAELAETRAAGNELLRAARDLDANLARAITELVAGSSDLDLAGRRWFHLVEAVNEASRRSKLPYYVDPSVMMRTRGDQIVRRFLVSPYRVERVRAARVNGTKYALLDVHRLGEARSSHQRLGFSRDFQPFALVVLDEMESYAADLARGASQEPPTCADSEDSPAVFARCGKLLRKLAPSIESVQKLVQRHELQHQIDGPELTHSSAVLKTLNGYESAAIDEVNRELSAYLSEFTTQGVSPKLALVHLLPFLYAKPGSAQFFVGRLGLSTLAEVGEQDVLKSFDALAALSDDELRERARDAYEELFDADLPDVQMAR